MRTFKIVTGIITILALTLITQIGGIVLILASLLSHFVYQKLKVNRGLLTIGLFSAIYLLSVYLIVPVIAKPLGRIPVKNSTSLKPLNYLTVLFNRNYVTPKLAQSITDISENFTKRFPGSVIGYLDGNFPFDFIPLLPHLSHSDGKKLDLAFFYTDNNLNPVNIKSPSWTGYGVSEEPLKTEINTTEDCRKKGYRCYDLLNRITPQHRKSKYIFDPERNSNLIRTIISNSNITKVFIEPHLKIRLGIDSDKVRFHGCQAVRHDDHIHIQSE